MGTSILTGGWGEPQGTGTHASLQSLADAESSGEAAEDAARVNMTPSVQDAASDIPFP